MKFHNLDPENVGRMFDEMKQALGTEFELQIEPDTSFAKVLLDRVVVGMAEALPAEREFIFYIIEDIDRDAKYHLSRLPYATTGVSPTDAIRDLCGQNPLTLLIDTTQTAQDAGVWLLRFAGQPPRIREEYRFEVRDRVYLTNRYTGNPLGIFPMFSLFTRPSIAPGSVGTVTARLPYYGGAKGIRLRDVPGPKYLVRFDTLLHLPTMRAIPLMEWELERYNSSPVIHVNRGTTSLGVFSEQEVREGLSTGRFAPTHIGWREGMATWQPLSQFPEFGGGAAPAVPPVQPGAAPTSTASRVKKGQSFADKARAAGEELKAEMRARPKGQSFADKARAAGEELKAEMRARPKGQSSEAKGTHPIVIVVIAMGLVFLNYGVIALSSPTPAKVTSQSPTPAPSDWGKRVLEQSNANWSQIITERGRHYDLSDDTYSSDEFSNLSRMNEAEARQFGRYEAHKIFNYTKQSFAEMGIDQINSLRSNGLPDLRQPNRVYGGGRSEFATLASAIENLRSAIPAYPDNDAKELQVSETVFEAYKEGWHDGVLEIKAGKDGGVIDK